MCKAGRLSFYCITIFPLLSSWGVRPEFQNFIYLAGKDEVNQDSCACAKQGGSLSIAYEHNISFTKQLGGTLAPSSGAVKQPAGVPDRSTLAAA